jgi:hypothetical protein
VHRVCRDKLRTSKLKPSHHTETPAAVAVAVALQVRIFFRAEQGCVPRRVTAIYAHLILIVWVPGNNAAAAATSLSSLPFPSLPFPSLPFPSLPLLARYSMQATADLTSTGSSSREAQQRHSSQATQVWFEHSRVQ